MLLLLTLACSDEPTGDTGGPTRDFSFSYPLDDVLRMNHVQVVGTHNSYHVAPDPFIVADWDYTHAPLDVQLSEYGVRQFELDLYTPFDGSDGFLVEHVPDIDDTRTCETLEDCLEVLLAWSDWNPAHFPLVVMLEPKDAEAREGLYDDLDNELLGAWPAERILTPDELQGDAPTLRDAVYGIGWPTLDQLRGHIVFVMLDSSFHRDNYTDEQTSLAGRVMFTEAESTDDDLAAFFKPDDPVGSFDMLTELAELGFLARTRADSGGVEAEANDRSRFQAALDSGAQFISTDYPGPVEGTDYVVQMPDGTPARCNPVSAPPECTSEALEDPQFIE